MSTGPYGRETNTEGRTHLCRSGRDGSTMGHIVGSSRHKDRSALRAGQGGRPPAGSNTVLWRLIAERGLRQQHVHSAMGRSTRALYDYMTLRMPVPPECLPGLCDLLDCGSEDLVDERGYLLTE